MTGQGLMGRSWRYWMMGAGPCCWGTLTRTSSMMWGWTWPAAILSSSEMPQGCDRCTTWQHYPWQTGLQGRRTWTQQRRASSIGPGLENSRSSWQQSGHGAAWSDGGKDAGAGRDDSGQQGIGIDARKTRTRGRSVHRTDVP